MNESMRIGVDRRFVGMTWLALALVAVAIVVGVTLGNGASKAVKLPPVAQDRAAVEYERFVVTHGIYSGSGAALPDCSGPAVTDELQAIRHGIYPRGLAAIEFCAHQADNARELDAIRRARSAPQAATDTSWWTDWDNFHGRK